MAKAAGTAPKLTAKIEAALVSGALPGEVEDFSGSALREAAAFAARALETRAGGKPVVAIETIPTESTRRQMRVVIVNDDMPFLVDSVTAEIAARGLAVARVLHPVIAVERDAGGTISGLSGKSGRRESVIYLEIERADAKVRRELEAALKSVLAQVKAAVADWRALQAEMASDAGTLDGEGADLLRWFGGGKMTLLGHARFARDGAVQARLGIAKSLAPDLLSTQARDRAVQWFERGGASPLILKSNILSPVHRRVPIELLVVPVRAKGKVAGLSIHAGLWTSAALNAAPETVPVLRERLAALQQKLGFDPSGHAGKALTHAVTALPHDLLIAMDDGSLETLALAAMSLADRPRPSIAITRSPLARHLHAFVWLPRDDLTTARRLAVAAMLSAASEAPLLSWSVDLDESGIALVRFTLDIRDGGGMPDVGKLNRSLEQMLRGWRPSVEEALTALGTSGHAARMAIRYADAFPIAYREGAGAAEAAKDIVRLDGLADDNARGARLYRNPDDAATILRLKIYSRGPVALSDAVPSLENFGFRVLEEQPTLIAGGALGHIHRFIVELAEGADTGALVGATMLEIAIADVLEGKAENDLFNQLMVSAGIASRGIVLFRALFRYLRQTGLAYGLATVAAALRAAPAIAEDLIALFDAMHSPDSKGDRQKLATGLDSAIETALASVTAIDDDRILRMFRAVIRATLRTNMFAPAAAEAIAFKIDSARVPGLPAPLPWREVWVYSPRVEGIHLRAGPVARGGLRWSDRRDDFRTEILGLMKAQRVKNAVIVPTGAKGGFYPKLLPSAANREAWLAEGTESYRVFIRTLLSVTDNLVKGRVVHPERVIIHDGDDPYFVVAADKGTATFSDVANAIALDRGFWLGDAFASGGSVGYDHKAMGITAKGGWVSVQRHFAEMGVDVQAEPVRVVGCGDMSGDVFGNGMLLSKSIKLVAAFDHRHIFIDPDPDAAKSWKERERMFALPRSSWADYDAKLISKGGGVFPRTAKTIALSPQIQAALDFPHTEAEPSALIAAILKSPADLIWFGGIGTYVKARGESNSEVGDRANDAHRVNAEELRAKVIGEGANLGVTQAARIAFGLKGGRINTDFIDNSAGVDCSDNEVNIKIALNTDMASGALSMKARNALLVRMTDDVAALVLEDNRLQTLALSIAQRDDAGDLPAHVRLIEGFEATGRLDRAVEGIASNDELLRRPSAGSGLTRPELAVLLATAKLALQDGIEATRLGSDPATLSDLMEAFPREMQKKHATAIQTHRLRGEIIATKLANRIVNRMGIIYPFELAEEEGVTLGEVAEAFVIAEEVYGIPALWTAIDAAKIAESARLMLFEQVALEMRAHMADILRNGIDSRSNDKAVAAYAPVVKQLSAGRETLLPAEARRQTAAFGERLVRAGAPPEIAAQIVRLAELDGAIGLAALSARKNVDVVALTNGFTALGSALGIDWAQGVAMQLDPHDPWERLLSAGLARDFQAMRLDFLERHGGKKPAEAVARWTSANASRVGAFRAMTDRARKGGVASAAMLAQIAGQARVLLAR